MNCLKDIMLRSKHSPSSVIMPQNLKKIYLKPQQYGSKYDCIYYYKNTCWLLEIKVKEHKPNLHRKKNTKIHDPN